MGTDPTTAAGDVLPSYSTYVKDMRALGYSQSCILDIDHYAAIKSATELAADADTLASQEFGTIDPSAFGNSPLGLELQHHATKAHKKLTGAVDLLSTALQGYSDAVTKAQKTILDADTTNQQNITAVKNQFTKSADETSTPIAAAPSTTNPDGSQNTGGNDSTSTATGPGATPGTSTTTGPGSAPLPTGNQCTVPTTSTTPKGN